MKFFFVFLLPSFFRDCTSAKLLQLFSGNLPAMFSFRFCAKFELSLHVGFLTLFAAEVSVKIHYHKITPNNLDT